jgi:hypothetical protein
MSAVTIPSDVTHGEELHSKGIIATIIKNGALPGGLPADEEVLYFAYNSSAPRLFAKDETRDCFIVTGKRCFQLEEGKLTGVVTRTDITKVVHSELGPVKYDKLTISVKGGKADVVFSIWAKAVAHFFYCILDDAIPITQRLAPKRDHAKVNQRHHCCHR